MKFNFERYMERKKSDEFKAIDFIEEDFDTSDISEYEKRSGVIKDTKYTILVSNENNDKI